MVIDPLKYRGLALQCCMYTILSSILNARIVKFVEENELIVNEQNGFRSGRSCAHHVFTLINLIRNKCKTKENIYATFVDFRKAFDVVNLGLLYHRLESIGIDGMLLKLIKSVYTNTRNYIRINDDLTSSLSSSKGLRQGDNLSPTLFSLYINDLISRLKKMNVGVKFGSDFINVLAYADDIVILAETEDDLQTLLNATQQWCNEWQVLINYHKTKVVHFRKKTSIESAYEFKLGTTVVSKVNQYRYLGVTLNYHLDENSIAEALSDSGSRALGSIIGKTRNNYELGHASFTRLFTSCVTPVLDYCSGAWSVGKNIPKLDNIEMRAIRFFCGLPKHTPLLGLIGDMGWIPSIVRRNIENVRLYNQIVKMNDNRLTKKLLRFDIDNGGDWSKNLEAISSAVGFQNEWKNLLPMNTKLVLQKLINDYFVSWQEAAAKSSKLSNMFKLKDSWGPSQHLLANLKKEHRCLISRLKCGNLALEIEVGRYAKIDREHRICKLCSNGIEDELHFLFECNCLKEHCQKLYNKLPQLLHHADPIGKLKTLCKMPYTFGNYIKTIWSERERLLNVTKV